MTVIIFIIVLAVLIFVHELGHFILARINGIRVDAFKIGFGPKVVAWKSGETEYGINLIPFGGFVKIYGENPDDENTNGPDSPRSFVNKNRVRQVTVLIAGVLFNFLFAWFLYACVFTSGVTATVDGFEKYATDFTNQRIMITYVQANSPAEKAGLELGDVIQKISGVAPTSTEQIQSIVNQTAGKPFPLTYSYGNREATTTMLSATSTLIAGKFAVGIAMDNVGDLKLGPLQSMIEGAHYTTIMIRDTAVGLFTFIANIFQGTANFADVAGPVGIAGIVGNAAELGFTYLVMITALISINLGVINLVPFPALDGGRTLFVIIEGITRRRIPARFTNFVNTVGFIALMILMVAVTYKDIAKLIQ